MTNTVKTIPGTWYTITCTAAATVTEQIEGENAVLAVLDESGTASFRATAGTIIVETEGKYHILPTKAPVAAGNSSGGATIQFDTTPKSGSTNAVTSGGLFDLLKATGVALGRGTVKPGFYGITIGSESSAGGWGAICLGKDAKVDGAGSISIASQVYANNSIGLGRSVTVRDSGVVAMAPPGKTNPQTILYLIGASTSLANTYENGEACLGYVVKDESGNILACGTRKLSELLTNNTAFAPAALDLDAPAPTPFLPTGITDPIEMDTPEDLTE